MAGPVARTEPAGAGNADHGLLQPGVHARRVAGSHQVFQILFRRLFAATDQNQFVTFVQFCPFGCRETVQDQHIGSRFVKVHGFSQSGTGCYLNRLFVDADHHAVSPSDGVGHVGNQIIWILQPDRQPHQSIGDSFAQALLGWHRGVRHTGRIRDDPLHAAQADGKGSQF